MPLESRLAWRNVWRNPRRTGLTIAATVFAVVLVVIFVAMAAGVHGKMIEDSVRLRSGHVTISGHGYLENQTLEQFVRFDAPLESLLGHTPGIQAYAPRIMGFGLLSKGPSTQGVGVIGVDPVREPTVSTLAQRVRRGTFISPSRPHGIVIGERLAKKLAARPGDELLLYSIAYSLETAYELFTVVGVMKLPEPALDRSMAIVSLADAQDFFVYGDRVTEVAILTASSDDASGVAGSLREEITTLKGPPLDVHPWYEVMPELVQLIFLDDAGMYILLVVLVVVVGFGILNTILMSVLERTRELGVLLALGLRPAAVFRVVYLESMFLAAAGLVIGLGIAIPLTLYLQAHPIPLTGASSAGMELFGIEPVMTWKLKPLNPIGSTLTVFGVAALAALYPAQKASHGRPVDALRSL